jgi:hypothetical protein
MKSMKMVMIWQRLLNNSKGGGFSARRTASCY